MAQIDDLIDTYLSACAVEGKSPNTVFSYRASLSHFRRIGCITDSSGARTLLVARSSPAAASAHVRVAFATTGGAGAGFAAPPHAAIAISAARTPRA